MYKDVINYQLAENTSKEDLLEIAQQVITDWMKFQPGFIKWEIHTNNNGSFTDIVYWDTEGDAKNAEKEMDNIPNANEWYNCYKEGTIKSEKLTEIATFEAE